MIRLLPVDAKDEFFARSLEKWQIGYLRVSKKEMMAIWLDFDAAKGCDSFMNAYK